MNRINPVRVIAKLWVTEFLFFLSNTEPQRTHRATQLLFKGGIRCSKSQLGQALSKYRFRLALLSTSSKPLYFFQLNVK